MKYLFMILGFVILSCTNQEPQLPSNSEYSDSERAKLLEDKKNRLSQNKQNSSVEISQEEVNLGDILFTPYVPPYPSLGNEGITMIENKISTLVAKYGITSSAGNPSFVIIPAIHVVSKNMTATAPTMYVYKYNVTFYTANLLDGTIFSSSSFDFNGVGESPLKSFINGFESVKLNSHSFVQMLTEGKEKALQYYEANCNRILQEANTEANQKNYAHAILILKSVPKEVTCYQSTGVLIERYFKANNQENCNQLLSQMNAELGKQSEMGNFNEKAMAYYALIPSDAPCFKEAEKIYANYIKKLDQNAKQNWIKEEREFNLRKEKQDQDHVYAITKAELETKLAIDGQSSLLDKYKKDHEYNKLPWLRKLVHLGEWDPFDATSRINK